MAKDLRSAALNADDITTETVDIPEWGGNTYGVKALTIDEQGIMLKAVTDDNGNLIRDKLTVQLVIATTVDPATGEHVFEQADAETLRGKSARAMNRLFEVAHVQAGLGAAAVEEAEEFLDDGQTSDGD